MALLKDNGTHTFLLMIGSRATLWMIPGGTHLSRRSMLEWCALKWGYTACAHRKTCMIDPGAPTQPSRCISALTHGVRHQPNHTSFPSGAVFFNPDLSFYSSSDLPSSPHGFPLDLCYKPKHILLAHLLQSFCWPFWSYLLLSLSCSLLQLSRKKRQPHKSGNSGIFPALDTGFSLSTYHLSL